MPKREIRQSYLFFYWVKFQKGIIAGIIFDIRSFPETIFVLVAAVSLTICEVLEDSRFDCGIIRPDRLYKACFQRYTFS